MSEYACTAPCFMDAFSVFLHQKLRPGGLSATVMITKTLPTKGSPTCLNLQPRRKWEFYLVNSIWTEHYSTVITTLRTTMLLCCRWPSADASPYCTLPPRQRTWAERPGPTSHLRLPTISGPLVMDARSAPSHLKSPLYQASTDFYPVKK